MQRRKPGIPNREVKLEYLLRKQKGLCAINLRQGIYFKLSNSTKIDLHHARMHNTDVNNFKYPDVVHSPFVLEAVDHDAHMNPRGKVRTFGDYRAHRLQVFLTRPHHSKILEWTRNPVGNMLG